MNAHPERMILAEHLTEFWSNPLRQENGNACADAQKFQMRNRAQPLKDVLEAGIRKQQGIAAGEQHITDSSIFFQIAECLLEVWRHFIAGNVEGVDGLVVNIEFFGVGDVEHRSGCQDYMYGELPEVTFFCLRS